MKAIKAKEIEKKFDEGRDISGHLDLSKARRPDQEQKRVNVDFPFMILPYPAKIKYLAEDKAYLVEFPDLPGCLTEGKTLEEATQNAKEALTGYLASVFERNLKIPEPSAIKGRNIHLIEPEPEVAVPIFLRKLRETRKLTQGDIAKVLGISYQAYQRLEKPGKSNPTLKTLERLAKVFNKDLRLEFA